MTKLAKAQLPAFECVYPEVCEGQNWKLAPVAAPDISHAKPCSGDYIPVADGSRTGITGTAYLKQQFTNL